MRDSVRAAFNDFTDRFEGYVPWMYPDVKRLLTTGRGNLIDPLSAALPLPWTVGENGAPANENEIRSEWMHVKGLAMLQTPVRAAGYYASVTLLRLSKASIDALCLQRLSQFEMFIRGRYHGYDDWPADAQLGILSMSWAMGPAFNFPKFQAAANAGDWEAAADECAIDATGNPGVVPRNAANKALFLAAALSTDADALDWHK